MLRISVLSLKSYHNAGFLAPKLGIFKRNLFLAATPPTKPSVKLSGKSSGFLIPGC